MGGGEEIEEKRKKKNTPEGAEKAPQRKERKEPQKMWGKKKGELAILHHLPNSLPFFRMGFQPLYHFSIYRKILLFLITV